jgi:hypothetical protein
VTEIRPAARELATLATIMRGWDYDETLTAMLAAKTAGWDFGRVFREVARLLLLDDTGPASLRHAAALVTPNAAHGPGPSTYDAGAAAARERLLKRREPPEGDVA